MHGRHIHIRITKKETSSKPAQLLVILIIKWVEPANGLNWLTYHFYFIKSEVLDIRGLLEAAASCQNIGRINVKEKVIVKVTKTGVVDVVFATLAEINILYLTYINTYIRR